MTQQYSLPAEWHDQDAILITWPHSQSAWEEMLDRVEQTYFDLVVAISAYQAVVIQTHETLDVESLAQQLSSQGANLGNCFFVSMNSNDTWARDHGPITVVDQNNQPLCLNFRFNGWGGKFESRLDDELNTQLVKKSALNKSFNIDWVLEGGSIESDGNGTLLTTRHCVLNPNRNGDIDQQALTDKLKLWFGCEQVIYLRNGELEGDDTDAHIDTLARFAPDNSIVFQGCQDESDAHFNSLQQMKHELTKVKNIDGELFRLYELPLPQAKFAEDGHRLPATYANFLITNQAVLVPTYNDKSDKLALEIIKAAFPSRSVKGIDASLLIEEHGSLHCITMQLPKGSMNYSGNFLRMPSTGR
jgi:agmatine deiminase